MLGRTIKIYLSDGTPNGVRIAELGNWTGKAVVCPRTQLGMLSARAEASQTGLYFLVGSDPDTPQRDLIYIGEADNVLHRLLQHQRDDAKDFFTQIVFFVSKDENMTKAHARFLESELIRMAKAAGRASLVNGNQPDTRALPESDVADMQYYLEQVQLLLPILGFSFLQPIPTRDLLLSTTEDTDVSPIFAMNPVGTSATAREVHGEFVVLKGSTARKQGVQSWTSYRELRDQLVRDGRLHGDDGGSNYVFQQDIPFASPSAAATVVYAGNQNGRLVWKVKGSNATYKEWAEQRIAEQEKGNR